MMGFKAGKGYTVSGEVWGLSEQWWDLKEKVIVLNECSCAVLANNDGI